MKTKKVFKKYGLFVLILLGALIVFITYTSYPVYLKENLEIDWIEAKANNFTGSAWIKFNIINKGLLDAKNISLSVQVDCTKDCWTTLEDHNATVYIGDIKKGKKSDIYEAFAVCGIRYCEYNFTVMVFYSGNLIISEEKIFQTYYVKVKT